MGESYYDILNVSQQSSPDEIKKNYRKLSLEFHPDRPNGNAEKFKKISEAYETLSNPQLRQKYDMSLMHPNLPNMNSFDPFMDMIFNMHGMNINGMHGMHSMNGMHGMNGMPNTTFVNLSSLFKPPTINMELNVTFEQSYNGSSIPVNIERKVGPQQIELETIYVNIPKGIDNDEIIMVENKGNRGHNGQLGDIKIIIKLVNSSINGLTRQGLDILYTHTITLKEALCGFNIDFDYINDQKFKIQNQEHIINPTYKKIIPNLGFTRGENKGNLIINFNIIFPTQLTSDQKSSLLEIL